MARVFVTGGARSGKSSYAERLASLMGPRVLYLATATAGDDEMQERIQRHRAQRPSEWATIEAPLAPARALAASTEPYDVVLFEDLTLLLSNLLLADERHAEGRTVEEIHAVIQRAPDLVIVSNEVGMGLVPEYPIGRLFRDAMGRVNQRAAELCDEAYFVVAGLPLRLK
ncbi:MAG: bifunctional adenosylcobinamide kinase/adenosylcobinamide-phosphate guanylyltransferase [Chloroflexi bacterium]|nr:bifunctional adenosylcobinamide kinase/adenosylcobinamide-phosphate guanylyltransferase [Chloroflexota bacterium]